jgi:aflatoxin B1 aldehyde reductase
MPLIVQNPRPRVILGLMTFGPDVSDGARITDIGEYGKVLDALQARGYNEVDTARVYVNGLQEAFTREAGWKDRGLTLATKIAYPDNPGDNTKEKVVESCHKSLAELGADCVDVSCPLPPMNQAAVGLSDHVLRFSISMRRQAIHAPPIPARSSPPPGAP